MFKNKMAFKLMAGFIIVVLISILIIGIIFITYFINYTYQQKKAEVVENAREISVIASEYIGGDKQSQEAYLRKMTSFAGAQVWIFSKDGAIIYASKGSLIQTDNNEVNNRKIRNNILSRILKGQQRVQSSSVNIFKDNTFSVAVPVYDKENKVTGGVLLHAAVKGVNAPTRKVTWIFISGILLSILVVAVLSIFYAFYFTKPILAMQRATQKMIKDDYSVRTNIRQNDEIGILAGQIDQLAIRLEEAQQEHVHLEQMRRDFISNISHEFRTPLTILRGYTEALKDRIVPAEDTDKYYKLMLKETNGLERLVSNLLDLSRLQTGKLELNLTMLDLNELIESVVTNMRLLAKDKQIEIEYSPMENLTPFKGDYDRLKQILTIFVDNAIKYSPKNGVIALYLNVSDFVSIIVEDHGYGIPEDEIPYIWDQYYRTKKTASEKGYGLGLAIAKQLIELHNGTVEIQSKLNLGTKVILKLPK